ncbi:hypothetical protein DFH08DRAFT_1076830 [Mycena albidolilacea]|uniref:XRRM domain-containing protein n=1 Tax=Mycena albidolilacea TaxID=1033008 RepID=A0AAD7ADK8_9AGAR|nr:hypothetical protein DFH08DRAFT_1076830 [Mycena albidolilacea]
MSAFAFVPRKVAKSLKPPPDSGAASSSKADEAASAVTKGKTRELPPVEVSHPEPAAKPQFSDEDLTLLLCLSLSKYRLWSDPDLRRNIEWSSRAWSNDGFFPLSYVLDYSCPLSSTRASEPVVVKALRTHAADLVDVRMTIPSGEDHPNGRKRGNFEIRPKFWDDDAVYPVSREGWENRTVYVENVPVKYKTLASFLRFILGLLAPANGAASNHNRVQGISVPPHHSDAPGTEPKLKSFALVTFASTTDAESLLAVWPWSRRKQTARTDEFPSIASEAMQFGFRALSKARWDELNAEYLAYRTRILADIAPAEPDVPGPSALPEPKRRVSPARDIVAPPPTNMSYPQNCLVFVRNIHPETNKTTLRTFFAKAVEVKEAIDYVDFNKGMDSCYLRLTTAAHAKNLVEHFAQNLTIHAGGLDDSGSNRLTGEGVKPVDAELVLGKREEVYWEKVPQKVCLQAVQKALGLESAPVENEPVSGEGRQRQRKKQKQKR